MPARARTYPKYIKALDLGNDTKCPILYRAYWMVASNENVIYLLETKYTGVRQFIPKCVLYKIWSYSQSETELTSAKRNNQQTSSSIERMPRTSSSPTRNRKQGASSTATVESGAPSGNAHSAEIFARYLMRVRGKTLTATYNFNFGGPCIARNYI